jgi:hypothetical protein
MSNPTRSLNAFGNRVLVRLAETTTSTGGITTEPWVMNRPEDGWSSYGEPWTWDQMARLVGWTIGGTHKDRSGEGFWLHRQVAA